MARTKTEMQADIESLQEQLTELRIQYETLRGEASAEFIASAVNREKLAAAEREIASLKGLALDMTAACSLLTLQVTLPELHDRILAAKVHTS
jgi:hypothetical protein